MLGLHYLYNACRNSLITQYNTNILSTLSSLENVKLKYSIFWTIGNLISIFVTALRLGSLSPTFPPFLPCSGEERRPSTSPPCLPPFLMSTDILHQRSISPGSPATCSTPPPGTGSRRGRTPLG